MFYPTGTILGLRTVTGNTSNSARRRVAGTLYDNIALRGVGRYTSCFTDHVRSITSSSGSPRDSRDSRGSSRGGDSGDFMGLYGSLVSGSGTSVVANFLRAAGSCCSASILHFGFSSDSTLGGLSGGCTSFAGGNSIFRGLSTGRDIVSLSTASVYSE